MVEQRGSNMNHPARHTKSRNHRAGVLAVSTGALLAFGVSPLAFSPLVHADDVGLGDLVTDVFGGSGGITSGADDVIGGTGDRGAQATLASTGQGIEHALAVTGGGGVSSAPLSAADSGPVSADEVLQRFFYDPIHTVIEDWINSSVGAQIDGFINEISGQFLIGDGAAGTAAHPGGGAGGVLFGDGGAGYDESANAQVAGGAGGAAGWFGNGGAGGAGGAGAAGGDGGAAGWLFGIGGDGGNAGDGASGLPALGGAGGNAGMLLGSHGDVGAAGTPTSGPPSTTSPISTTGGWLTNSDGQVVQLHGINYSMEYAGADSDSSAVISDADAAFLAANGFNAVRLAISWAAIEPEPGVFNDAYLASVEQTVQTLDNHGIHTLIDMHQDAYSSVFEEDGAPAWAVQDGGLPNPQLPFPLNEFLSPAVNHAWDQFWSNAAGPNGSGLENDYAQMWEHVANYFNGNPGVAGFEIMNEPYSGSQTLPSLLGSPFFEAQQLTPFYNQVTAAIRAVDPSAPVFFEPSMLPSTAGLPTHLGTVDATNTVYSFHDYCQFPLGPLGCLPNVAGIVSNAEAYATAHGIPAFMTEFGYSTDNASIAETMHPADQNSISWTEWAFTGQGDKSLVYNAGEPPVGANVNTAQLATIAEPYPQLISGTPNSWSFDNGTFSFSYSTAMADGSGSFAAGSHTTIAVPNIEFPNGYTVNVTGGQVISAPNAPELVVASDSGATTVSVTVTAGTSGTG